MLFIETWAQSSFGLEETILMHGELRPAAPARRFPVLDTRAWEWAFSFIWTVLGVQVLTWPGMARGSIFLISNHFLQIFFPDIIVALLIGASLTVVGSFGLAALLVNGRSAAIGPRIRAVAGIWRATFYTSVVVSMAIVSAKQGHLSPMVTVFSGFIFVEMYVCFRAPHDVRARRDGIHP